MNISLKDQRILVTGASRGIGRAIARQLSESGAEVIIHYNSNQAEAESLLSELKNPAHLAGCDLSKSSEVLGFIHRLVDTYGSLTALVNNAGISPSAADSLPTEEWLQVWEKTMAVNSTAVGILTKEFIAQAKSQAYAASKGAMVSLTRSIARHYGKQGIKAFLIAPGFTRTDMAKEILAEYGEDFALRDIALPELTRPEDIAPMVTLLCSGLADHATGTSIDMNAGSYVR
jgi:NAD(P)-dependent dehydrogenase (short-subunit alcohol dehydrogenase family)